MTVDPTTLLGETCLSCGKAMSASDLFCRLCGNKKGQGVAWYHQTWGIVILLFLVLGPLAIPLLWRSPVIPRERKLLLTILCIAFVAFFGWILIQTYVGLLDEITGSMNHYRKL